VNQGGDAANIPAISNDGRFIAFTSRLALVPDDTNGVDDVYFSDRGARTLTRASVPSGGAGQANGASFRPVISADGRHVVFTSSASNLVADDTNGKADIFRHDRVTGVTARISVATGGRQASGDSLTASVSDDGNLIAFASAAFDLSEDDANGAIDVFVRNVAADTTTRVSVATGGDEGDRGSLSPAISGDGNFVAFSSTATNLVNGDTNDVGDIFVRDRIAATTIRVSVSSTGTVQADRACSTPSLSHDGRFVSFLTSATTLVSGAPAVTQAYVRDTQGHTTTRPVSSASTIQWAHLSGDGRYMVQYSSAGVALRDRFAPATVSPLGATTFTWPLLSGNGRYVVTLDTAHGGALTVVPNPL
jgi:Tol biopolymer transport system component